MRVIRLLSQALGGTTLLLLLSLLTIGCGTNSTSTGTASSSTATTTPCPSPSALNQLQATVGTIRSINGNMLLVAAVGGNSIKVTYTSSTRFLRQSSLTLATLKEGTPVTVVITQNANNTYTASRIMLVNSSSQATRQRTNANCFRRSQFNNPGGTQSGGTANTSSIAGTVGQVSGNVLIVTDAQGNDYSLNVTATTQILQTSSATATNLKTGEAVTISGSSDGHGGINARSVTILPKLPTRATA